MRYWLLSCFILNVALLVHVPGLYADADEQGKVDGQAKVDEGTPLLKTSVRAAPVHSLVAHVYNLVAPVYSVVAPANADVLLQVFTQADDKDVEIGSRGAAPAQSYLCSADILSEESEYFHAALSDTWQQQQQQQQRPGEEQQAGEEQTTKQATDPASSAPVGARTIRVHMEEGELEAMQMLLSLMHKAAVGPVSQPRISECIRLADRFQAIMALDTWAAKLAELPAAALMPADTARLLLGRWAAQVTDAPVDEAPGASGPAAASSALRQKLRAAGGRAMLSLYGDVPAVINDAALRSEFCSRPHAAVLSWSESDELKVHSENCVVLLLSAWVKANPGSSAQQLEQLAHQVRVFHLGPCCQQQILPSLPWFKACSGMQHWSTVPLCVGAGICMKQGVEVERVHGQLLGMAAKLPAGWKSKPRRSSTYSKSFTWSFEPTRLMELNGGACYAGGFMMNMKVKCNDNEASAPPGKRICVSVGVDTDAMLARCGVPLPDQAVLRLGPVSLEVTNEASNAAVGAGSIVHSTYAMAVPDRVGCFTAFDSAPTFEKLVEPHLKHKKLRVNITLAGIDV